MDYVLVRVPPPVLGLPRPRFSLYLSSQLQYGVVLVYHRQCEFLLEETQGAIDRLLRLNLKFNIDMRDEETRQSHMIPDAAALFDETEGARDPFFGVMETGYGLPSPTSLIQRMEEVQPEQVPSSREPTPPSDDITASQESITLTEREPDIIPEPEFEGADLQETNMIELLLEQPDHFLEREDERQLEIDREREQIEKETEEDREPRMPDEREQERAALEREAARDLTTSVSLDLAQITGASSQEVVLLPEEDLGLPMEMPVLEEREKTPVSVSIPIPSPLPGEEEKMGVEPRRERAVRERSPDLEPAVVRPESPVKQRKRRRQLLFIDENTQISQEEMMAWIDDVETETRPLEALVKPPFEKKGAKELLENPCMTSLMVLETTDKDFSPLETPEMRRSPVPQIQFGLEGIPEERLPEMEDITEQIEEQLRPQDVIEGLETFHSLLPPDPTRRIVAQLFWRLLGKIMEEHLPSYNA
ncbi:meiotic recombination REC8-like protein [Labeo rohita]|uniref:Meiotic recombination REC8-like protein n=1 Tax=Labeo rohita TaxID=84645 RepID=A0A498LI96_LABRO|nr:meiotic recombination REC8-like protein [Labeo rohita]